MANTTRQGRKAILGKKIGMSQIFDEAGAWIPVTVVQAGPCTVLQVKTAEKDGYAAVQLGFEATAKKKKRPQQAYWDRLGVSAQRFVHEVPYVDPADLRRVHASGPGASGDADSGAADEAGSADDADAAGAGETAAAETGAEASGADGTDAGGVALGAQLGASAFKDVVRIDVRGVTKGRGFSGTIRRHGFASGDKSHGSKNVRQPGSTGMHTDPGRVAKGKKMPGQHGAVWRKARNLTLVRVDEEENLLLVKGSLPGPNGGYLYIEESLV